MYAIRSYYAGTGDDGEHSHRVARVRDASGAEALEAVLAEPLLQALIVHSDKLPETLARCLYCRPHASLLVSYNFV